MNESNENWPRLYSLPLAHLFPITFRLSSNIETEFHIKVTSIAKPFIWKNHCDICCYLWDYQDQLMWRLCMEESAIRGYMWTQIHRLTRLFPSTSFIQCLHAMTLEHERQILDVVYVRNSTYGGQLSGECGNLRILANRFKPQTTVKARRCWRCSFPGPQLIKLFLCYSTALNMGVAFPLAQF